MVLRDERSISPSPFRAARAFGQASPLPQHLTENKQLGVPLQDAPKPSLQNRQWIANMLRYCISDNHRDLRGLPLAILANNTLQVFGYNPIGTIYFSEDIAVIRKIRGRCWEENPIRLRVVWAANHTSSF